MDITLDRLHLLANPLILFAALLLAGYACGGALRRIGLPRITAYVLLGLVLGDSGLGWLDAPARESLRPFVEVGLGFLLVELGQRLDLRWMRRERWLWVIAAGEIGLTWLVCFTVLKFFDFTHAEAGFLAAVVISTSPAVVMAMVREEGADGQVSNRVMALAALDSLAAFAFATLLLPFLRFEHEGGGIARIGLLVLESGYLLAGSALLGIATFGLFRLGARWSGKRADSQLVLAMGVVIAATGIARVLELSVLCTMLTIGLLVKNADPSRRIRHIDFGIASEVLCVILFIVAGASAHFTGTSAIVAAAACLVVARLVAKAVPVHAIAPLTPLGLSRAGLVSLALAPLSGFTALVLVNPGAPVFESHGRLIAVFLTAVAMLELVGPILVQYAFRRARESHAIDEA